MQINTLRIYKGGRGGGGWGLAEAEEILKKIKQNGGFSLIFFLLFGKAPYIPNIMSLLPSSPKIITSVPRSLKINIHSPQIPKTPGGAPIVL